MIFLAFFIGLIVGLRIRKTLVEHLRNLMDEAEEDFLKDLNEFYASDGESGPVSVSEGRKLRLIQGLGGKPTEESKKQSPGQNPG